LIGSSAGTMYAHALLDALEIVGRERRRTRKVRNKTGLVAGPRVTLRFGIELLDRLAMTWPRRGAGDLDIPPGISRVMIATAAAYDRWRREIARIGRRS